jgi:serpin B
MRSHPCRSRPATIATALGLFVALCLALPDRAAPRGTAGCAATIADGNNIFAFNLYAALRAQPGNLFLSPFSIETAMSMVYSGARGRTAEQMAAVLHLPSDPQQAQSGFAELLNALQAGAKSHGYRLDIANGLWAQKDYPFLPAYLDAMRSAYAAELDSVDFIHQAEAVRARINSWVASRTQDKIKDLFPPASFHSDTRLVLANAIYFKGAWARPFKPELTHDAPFTVQGGSTIQVHMMEQQATFNYLDAGTFQVLELPYNGDTLAMDIFLPRKADGLAELERQLTAESLARSLAKFHRESVRVALPRFTMTSSFQLNRELAAMGMPLAFERGADFSGMSERGRELLLSTVVHKAFVDVNEQGTEAAAATGVGVVATAIVRHIDFRVDHPSLFLIRDLSSAAILFMGRLDKPA